MQSAMQRTSLFMVDTQCSKCTEWANPWRHEVVQWLPVDGGMGNTGREVISFWGDGNILE